MAYTLTFNGIPFDLELEGYTTANIEGRGLLHRALSSVEVPGRDGMLIMDQKLPEREITVHYRLLADNSQEFLQRLQALHDALKTEEDAIIQFGDESYYRYGRLKDAKDPPYDSYRGFGSFVLVCQDPYRYKDAAAISGASFSVPGESLYPKRIRSITATIDAARTGFTITNTKTGRKIILTGDFTAGQALVLNPEKGNILLNGQNIMNRLDFLASDWHDFQIHAGDTITAPQSITLNLSERAL